MHNNLSVYSLNSRAGRNWKRIGFTMKWEGNGVLECLAGRFWNFEVWVEFGKDDSYTKKLSTHTGNRVTTCTVVFGYDFGLLHGV